jgi:HPt (histidine-containing phosphotransfer) domain-containing protein
MAGFNDHLSKPIEVGALEAALMRHLPSAAACRTQDSDALRVEAAARRLAQVKPNDARFAPTLLETFAMRSGQLIEEIARAHDKRDCAALAHALESLRSSAQFMGASGLATLCDRLQVAARAHDLARTDALVRSLGEEHQSVLAVLLLGAREPVKA